MFPSCHLLLLAVLSIMIMAARASEDSEEEANPSSLTATHRSHHRVQTKAAVDPSLPCAVLVHFESCGTTSDALGVSSMTSSCNGALTTVTTIGTPLIDISNATLSVQAKGGVIDLYSHDYNLCDAVTCPLVAGTSFTSVLTGQLPPMIFKLVLRTVNTAGDVISCIAADFRGAQQPNVPPTTSLKAAAE